jgi:hypothetical protein
MMAQLSDRLRLGVGSAWVRPRWYIPAPASLAATWLRGLDDADLALA